MVLVFLCMCVGQIKEANYKQLQGILNALLILRDTCWRLLNALVHGSTLSQWLCGVFVIHNNWCLLTHAHTYTHAHTHTHTHTKKHTKELRNSQYILLHLEYNYSLSDDLYSWHESWFTAINIAWLFLKHAARACRLVLLFGMLRRASTNANQNWLHQICSNFLIFLASIVDFRHRCRYKSKFTYVHYNVTCAVMKRNLVNGVS